MPILAVLGPTERKCLSLVPAVTIFGPRTASNSAATALAVAMELLADQEWWLVGHAADLLGELGHAAQPAVADLQRLLPHEQGYTRRRVRAAIEKIEVS